MMGRFILIVTVMVFASGPAMIPQYKHWLELLIWASLCMLLGVVGLWMLENERKDDDKG